MVRAGGRLALEVDAHRAIAMHGIAYHGVIGRVVVVDAVIAVAVGQVADYNVVLRAETGGIVFIDVDPRVLVGMDHVVDDGIVVAAIQLNPGRVGHHHRSIGVGQVVADRVVPTADHADADAGVVIGDVVVDQRVGGVLQIDAAYVVI